MKKKWLFLGVIVLVLFMAGCDDGKETTTNNPTITGVTVSPAAATVNQGAARDFTADVSGTGNYPRTVKWSIDGAGTNGETELGSKIDTNGKLTVSLTETAGSTLTIRAASTLNSGKSGTAVVTVNDATAPTVTSITISPAEVSLNQGGTQQFTAAVAGANSPPQTVVWSIEGAGGDGKTAAGSEISEGGLLTISGTEPVSTVIKINAHSTLTGYTDIFGEATVNIMISADDIEKVWLVGDMTNWLEGPNEPIELTDNGDKTFTWSGNLYTDQCLKFSGDTVKPGDYDSGIWLRPAVNVTVNCANLDTADTSQFTLAASSGNTSWKIANNGVYTITVDLTDTSVIFTRTADLVVTITDIWLASTIASNWNPPFTDQWKFMQKTDGTFIWTGNFTQQVWFRFYTESNLDGNYYSTTTNNTAAAKDTPINMTLFAPTTSNSWAWSGGAQAVSIIIDPAAKTFTIVNPVPIVTDFTIMPPVAHTEQGKARKFTANFSGLGDLSGETVAWTIEGNTKTQTVIDADGNLSVHADEPVDTVITITATYTKTGFNNIVRTATATVIAPVLTPIVEEVIIMVDSHSVTEAHVERGETLQFSVYVEAFGGASTDVVWSIVETNTAQGTSISQDGLLTLSVAETSPRTLTIKATSVADNPAGEKESDTVAVHVHKTDMWFASNHRSEGITADWWGPAAPPENRILTQKTNGTYEVTFNSTSTGAFYFRFFTLSTKPDTDGKYFRPAANNTAVTFNTPTTMPLFDEVNSNSWMITRTGTFTIILDPVEKTFIFQVPVTVTGVTVDPATYTIYQGSDHQFTAAVNGIANPSQAVTWSIDGAGSDGKTTDGSEIDATGKLTVSETESAATITIRATSVANDSFSGTAVITIRVPGGAPSVESVTINGAKTVLVINGKTRSFTNTVEAINGAIEDVNWSIDEAVGNTTVSGSTISASGQLTVHASETEPVLTIRAASKQTGFESVSDTVKVFTKIKTAAKSTTVGMVGSINTTMNWTTNHPLAVYMYEQADNIYAWYGASTATNGQFRIYVGTTSYGPQSYINAINTTGNFAAQNPNTTDSANTGTFTIVSGSTQGYGIQSILSFIVWFDLNNLTVTFVPAVIPIIENVNIRADGQIPTASVFVGKGTSKQFTADVTAVGGAAASVTWSIVGSVHSGTTISPTGVLTVSSEESLDDFEIKATPTEPGFTDKAATAAITTVDTGFVPSGFRVWAVGGSLTPSFSTNSNEMTDMGSGVFTWQGSFASANNEGVAFSTNKTTGAASGGWGDHDWYNSPDSAMGNRTIAGSAPQTFPIRLAKGQANMWRVDSPGTYSITLDTAAMTVTFTRQ